MKIKKLLIGMTAAAMAATCLAMSASADEIAEGEFPGGTLHFKIDLTPDADSPSGNGTKLQDVLDPEDPDSDYYSVGAMGFYMGRDWKWQQSDWVGIDADGFVTLDYSISPVLTMSAKNTLGSFGIMFANIPEENFPYTIDVQEASFTTTDGETIEFTSLLGVQDIEEAAEGGIRFVLRPDDEVDEATGDVKTAACPELKQYVKWIDATMEAPEEPTPEPETPDSEEPAPETPDSTEPESQAPSDSTGTQTPSANPESGASAGIALAGIAVAAAALAVSKRK